MVNGKCPTWFVVKWLEKHTTHTAKAPRCDWMFPCSAEQMVVDGVAIGTVFTSMRSKLRVAPPRSDWTIYNERGKRVRFRRREPRLTVPPFGTLTVRSEIRTIEVLKALDAALDVFIRERKP